jgi:hypothetical protein
MVIIKISLGIFYLRIVVTRWQQVTVYVTVGIAALYGTYYFFAILFACGLPSKFLLNTLEGHCVGSREARFAINMTAGVINAVTDFVLAILPISLIRKASMPLPDKIAASMVLLLGCLGGAISVVRLAYIHGLDYNKNFFEVGVEITIWSIIEAGICITAASFATLRPLCRSCLDTTRRTITSVHSANDYRRSSALRLQTRDPLSPSGEKWLLRNPEPTFPSMRELDDMRLPTPSFGDAGMPRKANLIHGKIQWVESHVPEARPASMSVPRVPSTPLWPLSEEHPAFRRYEPAASAPTSQHKLEEVGVGAWRICDEKGDHKK